jgi:hypothetical protein
MTIRRRRPGADWADGSGRRAFWLNKFKIGALTIAVIGSSMVLGGTASAGAAVAPAPAVSAVPAASGGGCAPWDFAESPSYVFKACISMSGITLKSGAYLTVDTLNENECRIKIAVFYTNGNLAEETGLMSCASEGYINGPSWWDAGNSYRAVAFLIISGQTVATSVGSVQNT